jgi:MFS transporter, DHA2 family, methylenomycin A resistance protein
MALIGWRTVAGFGAALALPGSLSILRVAYEDSRARTRAVSIWAGINGVAIAIGPSVGGVLIQAFGRRSVFWAVVPIGVMAWLLAWAFVHESSDPSGRQLDVPGQALSVIGLGMLAFACIQGSIWGWGSIPIVAAFMIALAALAGLLVWESKTVDPLMPLDVFRNASFTASLAIAALMTFGMYALLFIFPLYLQAVRHHAPLRAGLESLPMGLSFAIVSPFAGRIANRLGPRTLIATGMVLGGAAIFAVGLASTDTAIAWPLAAMLVAGVALGLETGPLMAVAVASLPATRSGLASGLVVL